MGGTKTHAVARVLATHHRALPVSVAQATSGDEHRPLGGGTNAGRELERQRHSRGCPARVRGFCGPVRRRYCGRPVGPRTARGHPTGRQKPSRSPRASSVSPVCDGVDERVVLPGLRAPGDRA